MIKYLTIGRPPARTKVYGFEEGFQVENLPLRGVFVTNNRRRLQRRAHEC